jgi:hypothetical protein
MASKIIYLKVKLDIYDPDKDEITDEDINRIICEVDYKFKNMDNYKFESEIYERINPEQPQILLI